MDKAERLHRKAVKLGIMTVPWEDLKEEWEGSAPKVTFAKKAKQPPVEVKPWAEIWGRIKRLEARA